MIRNHNASHSPSVGRSIEQPPSKGKPGQVMCPGCGRWTSVLKSSKLRAHKDRAGVPCPQRIQGGELKGLPFETPEVHIPRMPSVSSGYVRAPSEPSRLDAGSHCNECGKWLPGERSLCGRCYAKRDANRNRR